MIKIIRLPFTDNTQYILVANFWVNSLMECCQNSSRTTGSMSKQNSTFTLDLLQESQWTYIMMKLIQQNIRKWDQHTTMTQYLVKNANAGALPQVYQVRYPGMRTTIKHYISVIHRIEYSPWHLSLLSTLPETSQCADSHLLHVLHPEAILLQIIIPHPTAATTHQRSCAVHFQPLPSSVLYFLDSSQRWPQRGLVKALIQLPSPERRNQFVSITLRFYIMLD